MNISKFAGMLFCVIFITGSSYAEVMQMSESENLSEPMLFVATDGNDNWSGRIAAPDADKSDGPFATLERARDEIRKLKQSGEMPDAGVTVEVRGGVYQREQPFVLGAEDSGSNDAPITYRARKGEEVRLTGGKAVTNFQPVTDPKVLERLAPEARDNVLQADLKALGVTDYGEVKGGGLELFFDDKPMMVSRWPNEGFIRITDLIESDSVNIRGRKGSKTGKFFYEEDRPSR